MRFTTREIMHGCHSSHSFPCSEVRRRRSRALEKDLIPIDGWKFSKVKYKSLLLLLAKEV
jgi:hypothetical protein